MRIAVVGTQNIGKSTFIEDFLKEFTMYKTPERTYRDVLKEKKLDCNKLTTRDSQEAIREIMIDQAMNYTSKSNVIHDRSVLDNVIYSMWKNDQDSSEISDGFIHASLQLCREACKFYDIIFFLPITKHNIPMEESDMRDVDPEFREEIDLLFKAAVHTYHKGESVFFDMKDCPAVIEIFGDQETRMNIVKMYLDPETGEHIEADGSFLEALK